MAHRVCKKGGRARPDEGAFRLLFGVMAAFALANIGAALSMRQPRHPDARPGPVLQPGAAAGN